MARYTGAVCKLCRREGQKLFLKGERCYSDKCALSRRSYAPGQHGQNRKKVSEYGLQLRAKQKTDASMVFLKVSSLNISKWLPNSRAWLVKTS